MSIQFIRQKKGAEEGKGGDDGRMMSKEGAIIVGSRRLCATWRNVLSGVFSITLQDAGIILWPMKRIIAY